VSKLSFEKNNFKMQVVGLEIGEILGSVREEIELLREEKYPWYQNAPLPPAKMT
jgi:hypothetical protein